MVGVVIFWVDYALTVALTGASSALADFLTQNLEIRLAGHLSSEREDGIHGGRKLNPGGNYDALDDPAAAVALVSKGKGTGEAEAGESVGEEKEKKEAEKKPHDWKTVSGKRCWQFFLTTVPVIVLQYPWYALFLPTISTHILPSGPQWVALLLQVGLDQVWDLALVVLLLACNTLLRWESFAYFRSKLWPDAALMYLVSRLIDLPAKLMILNATPTEFVPIVSSLVDLAVFMIYSYYLNRLLPEAASTKSISDDDTTTTTTSTSATTTTTTTTTTSSTAAATSETK